MPKPKLIETPQLLYEYFTQYKIWVMENPYKVHDYVGKDAEEVYKRKQRAITWSGFEGWLAENDIVSHLGNYEYNALGSYAEYLPIITRIKKECSNDVINGALAGVYNPNIAARLEGLKEQQEMDLTTGGKPFSLNIKPDTE